MVTAVSVTVAETGRQPVGGLGGGGRALRGPSGRGGDHGATERHGPSSHEDDTHVTKRGPVCDGRVLQVPALRHSGPAELRAQ